MARCESCGALLGRIVNASRLDPRYCVHCLDATSGQLRSKEQVRVASIEALMRSREISREEAEALVDQMLPDLPRWQEEAS